VTVKVIFKLIRVIRRIVLFFHYDFNNLIVNEKKYNCNVNCRLEKN
jgi:hypothetical protein